MNILSHGCNVPFPALWLRRRSITSYLIWPREWATWKRRARRYALNYTNPLYTHATLLCAYAHMHDWMILCMHTTPYLTTCLLTPTCAYMPSWIMLMHTLYTRASMWMWSGSLFCLTLSHSNIHICAFIADSLRTKHTVTRWIIIVTKTSKIWVLRIPSKSWSMSITHIIIYDVIICCGKKQWVINNKWIRCKKCSQMLYLYTSPSHAILLTQPQLATATAYVLQGSFLAIPTSIVKPHTAMHYLASISASY